MPENAAADRPLAADLIDVFDALFPPNTLDGGRYGAAAQAQLGRSFSPANRRMMAVRADPQASRDISRRDASYAQMRVLPSVGSL